MKKLKWRSFFSCVLVMTILMSIPAYNISVSAYEDNELNSETNIRDKIENILDISLNWMNDQKFDDGSFGDNTIINDTCYGVETLLYGDYNVENSISWLNEVVLSDNTDTLSRKLLATKDSLYADKLVKLQNADGGFGLNLNYSSDNLDSVLALEALVSLNNKKYNDAIFDIVNYLCKHQNDDGSWGYNKLNVSEPNLTSKITYYMVLFMHNNNLISDDVSTYVNKARNYLGSVCTNDLSESSFEIFMLNNILKLECDELDNVETIVDELISVQKENGSFYESIYKTNLVVKYLNNLTLSNVSPTVTDFKVSLDKYKLYLNRNSTVTGTFSMSYNSVANKECKLVTTVKNGDNVILTQNKSVVLSSNDTQLQGEAFSFNIIPESADNLSVITELIYDSNTLCKSENSISVINSENNADVLIIQDGFPWRSNAAETVLNNLDIVYDKMTAQEAQNADLSIYKMIYVSNDQNTAFYNIMFEIKGKLDTFVYNGGTLIYGVCDSGWSSGISQKIIPGDVMIKEVYYSYNNYITDATHPIVTAELSDGVALTNVDLYNNYASHRYFDVDTLPLNTKVILNAGENKPTLIEYPIGKGVVIGSTLTWEHSYSNSANRFGQKAFDDLFLYAYNIVFADEDIVFTSDIYTNKSEYSANEDVNIYLNCDVSAYQCRANGILEVRDKKGNLVEKISDILAVVYKDNAWNGTYQWNTDKYASGDYDVCINWYSNEEELLSSSKCSISIKPDGNVTDSVAVDKSTYKANEEIHITDIINSSSTNTYFNNLNLEISIADVAQENKTALSKTFSLSPKSEYTFSDYVKASDLGLGSYIVTSVIKSGDEVLNISQTSFVIEDYAEVNEKYTGSISVSKNSDKDQTFDFTVKNIGNYDTQNLTLKALVFNENGNQLGCIEKKLDLSKNESKSFSELYNTEALPIGNYPVGLVLITEDGSEIVLDTSGFQITAINKYDVTFVNDDGTVLSTQKVEYGKSATAPEIPTKESDVQYTYTFSRWDTDFSCVTSNMTVTAVYNAVVNKYTVTFVDDDGKVLNTQQVEYGKSATAPNAPSKEGNAEHAYSFTGWDTDFSCVTSDITVKAVYSAEANKYTVTFVNDDGTVLDTQQVEYGKSAVAPSSPIKENSAEYVYTFKSWDTDFSYVTSDITVKAIYSSTVNKYTVTFVNDDGTVLDTQQVEYGKSASAPKTPTKENSAEYTYTFSKWDKDFSCVTSNITVTAVYSAEKINNPTEPATAPATSTQPTVPPATNTTPSAPPVVNNENNVNSKGKEAIATGANTNVSIYLTMLLIAGYLILHFGRRNNKQEK